MIINGDIKLRLYLQGIMYANLYHPNKIMKQMTITRAIYRQKTTNKKQLQ